MSVVCGMPRQARLHFLSLKSSLVNLPVSLFGPLLERNIASPSFSSSPLHTNQIVSRSIASATCRYPSHKYRTISRVRGKETPRICWVDRHGVCFILGPLQFHFLRQHSRDSRN